MLLYKLLSMLLEYPRGELCAHWDELLTELRRAGGIAVSDKETLEQFIAWARGLSLTALQQEYVKTFDLTPSNALYLTHHLFDEQDRERGMVLVELAEFFQAEGFQIENGELPDYIPLVLEYVSTLGDELSARAFLKNTADVSAVIAANLEAIASPYAPLLRMVERHGCLAAAA